jgi:hypothetical protein
MRTAALPSFRKLYRRVIHEDFAYKDGLQRGMYQLNITYSKQQIRTRAVIKIS